MGPSLVHRLEESESVTESMGRRNIIVPGSIEDGPWPVPNGTKVITVANWIIKGTRQAHHTKPELLEHFCAWVPFPKQLIIPQYDEIPDDTLLGGFNWGLRPVLWSTDHFIDKAFE